MLTSPQLLGYYPDLQDPRTKSALALVHSRFSHQHVPELGARAPVPDDRPQRRDQHAARQHQLDAGARVAARLASCSATTCRRCCRSCAPAASDSATFDNVLELLVLAGRSLPHAMMMMIPEAYENRDDLPEDLKGFYAFHSCLMEPWDGPAAVAFTDGRVIGATLDRNGLRPGRWLETDGRLGRARLGDRRDGRAGRDGQAQGPPAARQALPRRPRARPDRRRRARSSARSPAQQPYGEWFEQGIVHLADLPPAPRARPRRHEPLHARQRAFGFTQEDLRVLLAPTAAKAEEPIGSMGNDAALAVLSDREPPLFNYFKQLFAQVTNPPIDPIREAIVMSHGTGVGSERNLLAETPEHAHQLAMQTPILFDREIAAAAPRRQLDLQGAHGRHHVAGRRGPGRAWSRALERVCAEADEALADGVNILILSRPRGQPRAGGDPVAARRRRRAPPPRARGHAPADRARARVRRAARGPPLRDADRLRRRARSTRT